MKTIPPKTSALMLLSFGLFLTGCVQNDPFRTAGPASCRADDCAKNYLHEYRDENFDLAFVEFTERGNVFDRSKLEGVLDHVRQQALSPEGVTTILFVHGWKHNAGVDDSNVYSFKELLRKTASLANRKSKRRLVGIYVGWRGQSIDAGFLSNITYWERKQVAEQVGKGGVSELLLRLERILHDDANPNKNLYLTTGHSFGAAIVLSSLNEILLERVASEQPDSKQEITTRPFGHGVALVNPAIEANEILQLKELVAGRRFGRHQSKLLHVISSNADRATEKTFRWGQMLGVGLRWNQDKLDRTFAAKPIRLKELDLDTTTVGNFLPFQTGYLTAAKENPARQQKKLDEPYYAGPPDCVIEAPDNSWDYVSYVNHERCIDPLEHADGHIPARSHEPLAFIKTDAAFSRGHNDVFNDNVAAYLAAIMADGQYKQALAKDIALPNDVPEHCQIDGRFQFGECFQAFHRAFCATRSRNPPNETCTVTPVDSG